MRKRISGLSVSQKTLLLLILFIMFPLMVIGWLVAGWMSRQEIQAQRDISMQRLYSISENLAGQLDTVRRISNSLSVDEDINDVAQNKGASLRHYAVSV